MVLAIKMHEKDNVVTAMESLAMGERVRVLSDRGAEIEQLDAATVVPLPFHKVALSAIGMGAPVVKYGETIGYATAPIARGDWVHLHNVQSANFPGERAGGSTMMPRLSGYLRPDGSVGVRNHLLVMATCDCAYETAKRIAAAIPGAVAIGQFHGCGADPMVVRQLVGVANNPNVGATLLVGLGCETITVELLGEGIRASGKPLADVVIQRDGGTVRTIDAGTRLLREMATELSKQQRDPFDISRLAVALQCGGSDAASGIAANPAVGVAVDRLIDAGATVLFSETVEMTGTAHLLARRAANAEIARRIHEIIDDTIRWRKATGLPGLPLPKGNEDGGLTTIEEKSLGAIRKAGSRPIQGVLENSRQRMERPSKPGLYIQDGTAWDVASITHMVAVGAQMAIFTTGRGSTTGHAIIPVIKVTGNPTTYDHMSDNMDVNAGRIILGQAGIVQVGEEIFELALAVAAGAKSKPEVFGFEDFQIYRQDAVAAHLIRACS